MSDRPRLARLWPAMRLALARHHIVDQRQRATASLRPSEERCALALRGAGDGHWDWDLRHATISFSERWKEMLGYETHEVGDHPEEWLHRVHPDDIGKLQETLASHLQGSLLRFE